MRKIFAFIFAFASLYLTSQTTCQTAAPFCAGGTSGITFPATTVQATPPPNAPAGPDYGCLGSTPNAAWYYMQIGTSGPLDVLIAGQLANGGSGYDVDFICWGPFSSLANVCNSLTASFTVDCSYSGSYTETLNIANGITGQYYMVLITNFSNATQNIVFNQINTTTPGAGNTNCAILQVANTSICAGSVGTITATNNGNLTSPNYSINPSSAAPNSTGIFTVAPTVTTTYTLYVTGLNSSGATVTQTATTTMSVNTQPLVAPTLTQTSCTSTVNALNLHLTFNPPTPVPTYTITWSGVPNGITSANQTSVTGGISAGAYTATIVAAGGCSVVSNLTITPQPAPATFTLIPLSNVFSVTCSHPNVVVDASEASFTYTWTNGTGTPINDSEALFNASNLGTWTITGLNPASGCVASHTFMVVQNTVTPSAVVSPSFQNITCVSTPSTVSVTATPTLNTSHHIYAPGGAQLSVPSYTAIYVPGAPGLYIDTVRNDLSGCYVVKTFSVTSSDDYPTLTVTSGNNFTVGCLSHSLSPITIFGETTPPPGGGSVTYTLLAPNFSGTYGFGPLGQYNVSAPGTWTAVVKSLANNCETKIPFSIIQYTAGPDIHANVPQQILSCDVNSTTLTAITSNTNVAFSWSYPGPTGALTVVNPTVAVNTTTNVNSSILATYTLSLLNNDNGCTSTLTVLMQQNLFPPKAVISAGANFSVTCATQTVQLSNNSITGIPNTSGFPTNQNVVAELWQGPTPQAPLQLTANYIAATPGLYTLTAKDLNNGCTSQTTTNVFDNRNFPTVTPPAGPVTLDCGSLTNTIGLTTTPSTGLTYYWLPPANVIISGTLVTVPNLPVTEPGEYRVVITNSLNGCSATSEVTVVPGELTSSFTTNVSSGYAPLTVNFTNTSHSSNSVTGTTSVTSVWSFGNGSQTTTTATSISANALYSQPGTYTVILYANKGACQDTAVHIIHVDIPSKLEIPNVFTPNGDGVNDIFFLKVSNLTDINALIYDRWGHKVYELVSTTGNIAWDGTTEAGKDASAGTYFYIIKATGKDGQNYDTKGTITLYR